MKVASTVRGGDKGSYGFTCPTLRCSGQNAVRICCCKRESKHSTVNWVQYSSDGIRICRSKSWLKRPNPQHLHALLTGRSTNEGKKTSAHSALPRCPQHRDGMLC